MITLGYVILHILLYTQYNIIYFTEKMGVLQIKYITIITRT